MGCGGEDSAYRFVLVVPAVSEGIDSVCRGVGGGAPGLLIEEGAHGRFRERRTAGRGGGRPTPWKYA